MVSVKNDRLVVTVAGMAAGQGLFQYDGKGPAWDATWDELPKTTVSAEPDEPLRSVLRRGAHALGVSVSPAVRRARAELREQEGKPPLDEEVTDMLVYAAFHRGDDDEAGDGTEGTLRRDARSRKRTVLVVRDAAGHAVWRRPPFDATMAELVDAHDVGLLDGDPLQVYLVLVIPQGEMGVLGEWSQFQENLEIAWHLTGVAAQIAGAFSFIEAVRRFAERRSGKAAEAVKKNSTAWAERGGAPADLKQLLASQPRDSAETAALLGCSEAEAEAILWGLGFTPETGSGRWAHRRDV